MLDFPSLYTVFQILVKFLSTMSIGPLYKLFWILLMRSRLEGSINIYRNGFFENRVQHCMPITMLSSPKTIGKVSERYMTAIKLKILWKLVGLAWDLSRYFTWQVGESRITHVEKPGKNSETLMYQSAKGLVMSYVNKRIAGALSRGYCCVRSFLCWSHYLVP